MKTIHYLSDQLTRIIEPIIKKIVQLRNQLEVSNPRIEHSQVIELLRECRSQLKISSIEQPAQNTLHYLLCAAMDEAFFCNAHTMVFMGQSGTSLFHQSIDGGERFFDYIHAELAAEPKNLSTLGVALILLNIGFQGKYAVTENGNDMLSLIKKKIYDAMPHAIAAMDNNEFVLSKTKSKPKRPIRSSVFSLFIIFVLISVFYVEYSKLDTNVQQIIAVLNNNTVGVNQS